jgi:hypothetical protein
VARGERLIKIGDSWFSAKAIEVACFYCYSEVERWIDDGGYLTLLILFKH